MPIDSMVVYCGCGTFKSNRFFYGKHYLIGLPGYFWNATFNNYLINWKETLMTKMSRVIIALVVLASGCVLNSLGVQFTADIGDTPFKAVIGSWEDTDGEGNPKGHIVAADVRGNVFDITVGGAFEERTYGFGLSGTNLFEAFATYLVLSEGVLYLGQSGTLTVTSKTPDRLTGTFAMTLAAVGSENTLAVTNGSFDLPVAPAP